MEDYPLNHTSLLSAEIERLEWMHRGLIVPIMGKTLLPATIEDYLQGLVKERKEAAALRGEDEAAAPSVAVADIATGTGLWLVDLAKSLPPSARLDGYDYETSKLRGSSERPPNVNLGFGNVLEPFPESLHGQYDLVHVRLLTCGLKAADWKPATENMIPLLRPGGYLLWEDADLYNLQGKPTGSITEKTLSYICWFGKSNQSEGGSVSAPATRADEPDPKKFPVGLDKLFTAVGLEGAEQKLHPASAHWDNPQILKGTHIFMYKSTLSLLTAAVHAGGHEELRTVEDAQARADEVKAELDAGKSSADFLMWRTIARKPM